MPHYSSPRCLKQLELPRQPALVPALPSLTPMLVMLTGVTGQPFRRSHGMPPAIYALGAYFLANSTPLSMDALSSGIILSSPAFS